MMDTVRAISKPQRWDLPFWSELSDSDKRRDILPMTKEEVERVLTFSPFREMDPKKFPASCPLEGVLLNDARIRVFKAGALIVRQGDYGNSAFFVMKGAVRVLLESLPEPGGRSTRHKKTFFGAIEQFFRRPKLPEVRDYEQPPEAGASPEFEQDTSTAIFVQDVPVVYKQGRCVTLGQGEFFGEIAALTRSPRSSSIIADGECELLEIRWQGLRELRLRAPELKAHIDKIYRERSLAVHLRETAMFRNVPEDKMKLVAAATEFQSYGNFDWHSSYKKAAESDSSHLLETEPLIAREGDYPNGIFLVRSGFARISRKVNHGERTLTYLGKGQVFGFEEFVESCQTSKPLPFRSSLRAIGYTDVLFIPTAILEQFVLPTIRDGGPSSERRERGEDQKRAQSDLASKLGPAMLEFLVERRFINGTATMIIDMDRCTRCDDCVRACAANHDNNPRFVREGPIHSHFMIAHACMHCQDPVCMIGCPTGAIHRETARGEVVINDLTCIGCATCANSCPYDNIQMVNPRDRSGNLYYDRVTRTPIQKAAKCDLCSDTLPGVGPACANACPHDAMIRVDMRDFERLSDWFNR